MTQQELGRSGTGPGSTSFETQSTTGEARREAGSVVQEARGAARDVADEARRVGERAKSEAAGLVGTVRSQIAEQAEAQKAGVADRVASVASHLHHSADDLRDREGWLADLIDRGARELDGFADELKRRDVRGLLGGVESFAHRHPAVFIGSAVAVGFALSRMVRSGAEESYRGRASYGGGSEVGYAGSGRSYPGAQRVGPTYPSAAEPTAGVGGAAATVGTGSYIDPRNERPDLGPSTTPASSRPVGVTGGNSGTGTGGGSNI